MDVMCIFICGFLILTTVDRVKTDCITDNNREVWNIKEETRIGHEDQIIWRTDYDSSWRVIKPNNSFVDVYFINVTESNEIWLNLIVNVTGSTDLDNAEDCSGVKKDSFFLQCGNIPSLNFTVRITPENEHTPEIFTDINMTKELNEDYMVSRSVIEYGKRVKDEDCPKQRLEYSVVKQGDATITGHDGTEYFDIYDNGTLYLKSALDYETIVCGLGDNGMLYLNVIIKDENPKQKTATSSLTMTVIDLDDEPPKFVDMLQGCNKKCKTCYTKSFIGNTSYESKGEITVNPPLIAEDIYSVNASVILYYIRKVTPDEYSSLFMININNGTISVSESLQNATNNTIKEDFIVLLHIQAISNRTLLGTMNVTLNLTVVVPPEISTFQASTMEETTTEEETTTIEQTTVLQTSTEPTSPEVKTTHAPTTAPTMSGSKENDDDLIVIIVPIVAAVLVILLIIVIFANRRAAAAKRNRYIMEKKSNDISGIEKH
ncbi:cadherin-89D-like isoform X4 [Mytilus galloprovincialis]|uniref:cadherin-89D-like isoform X4 n=1 Tax=Mytilus galloprovincialis TaxID=29158 RepID=UPI003F7CA14B